MKKSRLLIAAAFMISLTVFGAGAMALGQSRQAALTDTLLEQIDSACVTPDAAGCAALLNRIEPGA